MEKSEIKAMFKLIDSAMRIESKTDAAALREQLETWYSFFKDDDPAAVRAALNYELTHNHFKPNIADIKGAMRKLTTASPAELWRTLQIAADNGSKEEYDAEHYKTINHFKDEFAKLPPILKAYLGSVKSLKEFYGTDHNTFDKKQFEKEIKELQEATEQQPMITGGENNESVQRI